MNTATTANTRNRSKFALACTLTSSLSFGVMVVSLLLPITSDGRTSFNESWAGAIPGAILFLVSGVLTVKIFLQRGYLLRVLFMLAASSIVLFTLGGLSLQIADDELSRAYRESQLGQRFSWYAASMQDNADAGKFSGWSSIGLGGLLLVGSAMPAFTLYRRKHNNDHTTATMIPYSESI